MATQNSTTAAASVATIHTAFAITGKHPSRRGVAAVAAAGVALVLAACSSGGGRSAPSSSAPPSTAKATTTTVASTTSTVPTGAADLGAPQVTTAQASSALGTGDLNPDITAQVVAAVHTYENAATGTPLGTGQPANLDSVLTAAALARLTPDSRGALTDEGIPPLGAIRAQTSTVALDAFAGPDLTMIVNATVDLQVSATSPAGAPASVKRAGTLTFVNDGGTWKIDAFNLAVERDVP